ncbi:MAG: NAD(P)-binding domain-containing protein [Acidimicrobiia bacterium]|nr:NAD(P)-binding domain-containing protein [Acidimicrobiia bacterium]
MDDRQIGLVVIGGSFAGLSVAIEAREAGVAEVVVVHPGAGVLIPDLIGQHAIDVRFRERVISITSSDAGVEVVTSIGRYNARAVVLADHFVDDPAVVDPALAGKIHHGTVPREPRDLDILVIGSGELAIEWSMQLAHAGAGVVLAAGGMDLDERSRVARSALLRLEAERRATVLWNSVPDSIGELDGHPMAYFEERRTPDLQFDHVVYAAEAARAPTMASLGVSIDIDRPDRVFMVTDVQEPGEAGLRLLRPGSAWPVVRELHFPETAAPYRPPARWRPGDETTIDELRTEYYNATITHFERSHSDLWMIRVKPDHGDTSHLPGQYASLGLGYWEPRSDNASDPGLADRWGKLVRRSYSISSRIYDDYGYLTDAATSDELEFYVVLVPPSADRVPVLTPRLALKRPGDRIYLGPKVAGRYTLNPVTDPRSTVLLLSTGTGEAPHNAMVVELLRKGHMGPIVSAVSVRVMADLGYEAQHAELVTRYANYHYLPIATREPGIPKRYIQDLIRDGDLAELGIDLDPDRTHVYLCGNPAMIGLPEDGEGPFPEPTGVVELLVDRGFTLDRRNQRGNIHYEEYW